jgi:hypothetical protein
MNEQETYLLKETIMVEVNKKLRATEEYVYSFITERFAEQKMLLEQEAMQIFENAKFMERFKRQVIKNIEEEVRVAVKNADLHSYVSYVLKQYSKQNFKPIVEKVIEEFVKDINKKLNKDYEITKQLCYAIDHEIKHTVMKLPISATNEDIIRKKISHLLENKEVIKRIE